VRVELRDDVDASLQNTCFVPFVSCEERSQLSCVWQVMISNGDALDSWSGVN